MQNITVGGEMDCKLGTPKHHYQFVIHIGGCKVQHSDSVYIDAIDVSWQAFQKAVDAAGYTFPELFQLIQGKSMQGRVLIHCLGGQTRGPSLFLAYMVYMKNMDYDAALAELKSRRSISVIPEDFEEGIKALKSKF